MDISTRLVRRLLTAQFPRWAGLPLAPADPAGRDNVIYRLGADLAVRLPRRALGAALAVGEAAWARVRGWALDFGLMCATRAPRDPVLGGIGRRAVREVLADQPIC